jgi:hypothetical protein
MKIYVGMLLLLIVGITNIGYSHSPFPVRDGHLVKNADFIFEGIVQDIKSVVSKKVDEEDLQVPFTFVTYEIIQILKGKYDSGQITLQFMGGCENGEDYFYVQGIPLFDIGDHDIMFIKGNIKKACPVVGWEQGRTRVIQDSVYNDSGEEIWLGVNPFVSHEFVYNDILDQEVFLKFIGNKNNLLAARVFQALHPQTQMAIQRQAEYGLPNQYIIHMIIADFNRLLRQTPLFSENEYPEMNLSTETLKLLETMTGNLSEEERLIINRKLLEGIFPTLILDTLDETILFGETHDLEDVVTFGGCGGTIRFEDSSKNDENSNPIEANKINGVRLGYSEYIDHISNLITFYISEKELINSPQIESADPNAPVKFLKPRAVPPILFPPSDSKIKAKTKPPTAEMKLYLKNGMNPVIPPSIDN